MKYFLPSKVLVDRDFLEERFLEVDDNGIISKIGHVRDLTNDQLENSTKLEGYTLPGLVNAHSHAFQVLLRGPGDNPKNFHDWVDVALYPLVRSLTKEEIYTASKVAFAQMVRNGTTAVAEFHYIHNLLPHEQIDAYEPDPISQAVIQAALDVGIRMRFLYTGYDMGTKPGQERFHRTVGEVRESLTKLRKQYQSQPLVAIGAAPHSLHGASENMIQALKEWTQANNEVMHIHLLEQQSDREFALEKYNLAPVQFLEERELLFDDLNIVHGIWMEDTDLDTLSRYKISHIYNPVTNMYLGDGIAPIPKYYAKEIPTALGNDANYNLSIWQEMRTTEWLQRVQSLEMGVLEAFKDVFRQNTTEILWDMATKNGAKALKMPIGEISEGKYADFIVITSTDLSLRDNHYLLSQLIFSSEISHLLQQVYVGGSLVYDSEEKFTKFHQDELIKAFSAIDVPH